MDAGGVDLPAAGVHEGEPGAGPLGVIGHPVTGHPGNILDHSLAAAQDPVDQRRLANIGPADDRHHRHGAGRLGVGVLLVLAVEQREVLIVELELVQAHAQGTLNRQVIDIVALDGLRGLAHSGVLQLSRVCIR
jgi:hypothetical protein